MPLTQAVYVLAVAADRSAVAVGLPDVQVELPSEVSPNASLLALAAVYQLSVCELDSGVFVVTPVSAGLGCVGGHSLTDLPDRPVPDSVLDAGRAPDADPLAVPELPAEAVDELPRSLGFRFRVIQIDDSRAARLGIDWRALLTTSNALAVSVPPVLAGFMASPDLDGFVAALESQGVATRLEDMRLQGVEGQPVTFNRGGSINVNLVGGGDATVSRTFQFGLGFTVTGTVVPGGVRILYTFDDSSPSNVTDATNVQISSTSNQSSTVLECGGSSLLAALSTERSSRDGSGLPGISRVPVLGYAAGQASDDQRRSMIAVTLEVSCG